MRVQVVNERDELLGHKERDELTPEDIMRVSGLWIVNSASEVLIAQRAANKRYDPLKWAVSVAGTVDEGETYASNIVKETHEELGIVIEERELIRGVHQFVRTNHLFFYQAYFLIRDIPLGDFRIEKDEVESIRWVAISELVRWFSERPGDFIPSFGVSMQDLEHFAAARPLHAESKMLQ